MALYPEFVLENDLIKSILDLGVVGVIAVMWWLERKDRLATEDYAKMLQDTEKQGKRREDTLIQLVTNNTKALSDNTIALMDLKGTIQIERKIHV